ncbi:MAG: hypothetical protein ABSF26_08450 [Thermoguttaceae bacterium]|jgi:ribosomal protein S27AE
MNKQTFEAADPIVGEIAEAVGILLGAAPTDGLRRLLTKLNKTIGDRYAVSLVLNVDVFDREKERFLPLLQTGMSGFGSEKPYQTWSDSTPQRYIVDGEMQVVPHDRCPKCWDVWDFKFQNLSCAHCGATLGKDVKMLLDTDMCPWCEDGKVSMSQPTCPNCGHIVDPETVVWG